MEFALTAEHKHIQAIARELAADFAIRAGEHDRDASPPVENYAALRDAGFYGITVPKALGGWGAGLLGYTIAAEELGQGCGLDRSLIQHARFGGCLFDVCSPARRD